VLPNVGPAPALKVEATPERLARGQYLFDNVSGCRGCHSDRDFTRVGHPVAPGTDGQGGFLFGRTLGLPGDIPARNITPAAIGKWSDGELYKALTTGETPDHRALFPIMPWPHLAKYSKDDLYALMTWIRQLRPIDHAVGDRDLDPPLNLIVNTMPVAASLPEHTPAPGTPAYGEYLVNAAACSDCHTPADKGQPLPGMAFSGGMVFHVPEYGTVGTANITPDKETGIGEWTRERFIARFQAGRFEAHLGEPIPKGTKLTVMPWVEYSGMTDEDIGAIYDFLRTQPAVNVKRETFTPLAAK
jgi:mono/diheme cytochrome c family protein